MLILPLKHPDDPRSDTLLIVLDDDSLERMKQADPAEVDLRAVAKQTGFDLVNPTIFICYEKPTPELQHLMRESKPGEIIKFLQRGWQHRPDKGDHDLGPQFLREIS